MKDAHTPNLTSLATSVRPLAVILKKNSHFSVGFVSEDGERSFYAELTDTYGW